MTIRSKFDKSIMIKRLSTADNKSTYSTVTVTVGHRQNLSQMERQVMEGATNKSYKIWCDLDEDVKEGDRLTIKGVNYELISIEKKDYGTNQHLELICNQIDDGGQ